MPQASDAQRSEWGVDSARAVGFLRAAGYLLTEDYRWKLPVGRKEPTEKEFNAVCFLVDEWDFGGLYFDPEAPPARAPPARVLPLRWSHFPFVMVVAYVLRGISDGAVLLTFPLGAAPGDWFYPFFYVAVAGGWLFLGRLFLRAERALREIS